MRLIASLIGACLASGCATPHLYPVCFHNVTPTPKEAEYYFPGLERALKAAVGDDRQVEVATTRDGRWVVARVTSWENAAAARVWPRIGCIGAASTSDEVMSERDCVEYIRQFVEGRNYFAYGNARDDGGFDIWNQSPNGMAVVKCRGIRLDE